MDVWLLSPGSLGLSLGRPRCRLGLGEQKLPRVLFDSEGEDGRQSEEKKAGTFRLSSTGLDSGSVCLLCD